MRPASATATAGRLVAISDLHLSRKENREALEHFAADTARRFDDDWLIVAGDVGERVEHLQFALGILTRRFARVFFTPGNHDLWCPTGATDRTRGQARYDEIVATCREFGALTPEDPYARWPLDSARGKPVEFLVMTSRPIVSHASTILDQVSMRAGSANVWTSVRVLSVGFVAVLTAAAAQLSFPLPFTPVPFTIQPMIVLIGAAALGSRLGALSQLLYLTLGLAGLPVFAFSPELPQGFLRLMGPTGGYLMAYPLAAFVTGLLAERGLDRRYLTSFLAMAVGLTVIFAGGVLWLANGVGTTTALATGLYPFVMVDVIKIVAAGLVLPSAWKFLSLPKDQ